MAIGVETPLFSVHAVTPPGHVLARLAAYAVHRDGIGITTVCLACAASLFDRLA